MPPATTTSCGRPESSFCQFLALGNMLGVPVDELAHHYGFDPHVGLLRGWALVLPAAAAWWLFVLPASRAPAAASPPAGAVPQAG